MSDFSNDDFHKAFLVLLGGAVTHRGVNMADEGAYRATCDNIEGLAKAAARVMAKYPTGASRALKASTTKDGGL